MTDQLESTGLRIDVEPGIVTVTLDRPDRRNAQDPAMWRALTALGAGLPEGTRVVVVRAEGASFSAGLDRRMFTPEGIPGETSFLAMAELSDEALDEVIRGAQAAFSWWRRPDVVTIAAVQGHAVGAGFQLALACDIRVLAEDAQLAMKEPSLGLVPDLCGTKPLVECVGYSRALEICATGRWVGAKEAARIGLANAVVPREELDATARDLAAALLAAPAGAVRETKALLLGAAGRSHADQQDAERAAQAMRIRDLARGR